MLPMGLKGFWEERERITKLKNKKPALTCLSESISWEAFRPLLEKSCRQESMLAVKELPPLFYLKCWFSSNFLT